MKVEETTHADFDRVFAVNTRGAFVATQAVLKHIKSGGRIIMIGSCVGERVLYGSDHPTQPFGFELGKIVKCANLNSEQLDLILGKNLARVKNLCLQMRCSAIWRK